MTKNTRYQGAVEEQDRRILVGALVPFYPAKKKKKENPLAEKAEMEKAVMELRVQLKICEGCGCLWYRVQTQESVYCRGCEEKLREFPTPESRKRRGRPTRMPHMKVWKEAEAVGGAS